MNTWAVPQFALFNLEEDIEEATDVSDQNQKVFDRLKNQLQSIIDQGRTRHWTIFPNLNLESDGEAADYRFFTHEKVLITCVSA